MGRDSLWNELCELLERGHEPAEEELERLANSEGLRERLRERVDAFWVELSESPPRAAAEARLGHLLALRLGLADLRADLALRDATASFVLGRPVRAAEVLEGELVHHPRGGPGTTRLRLLALQGKVLLARGQVQPALVAFEEALALVRAQGLAGAEGSVLSALGNARLLQGDLASAADYYRQAQGLAERYATDEGEAVALGNRALVAQLRGEHEAARGDYELALDKTRAGGDRRCAIPLHANLGLLCAERGELEAAREQLEQGLELTQALEDRASEALLRVRLAHVDRMRGARAAAHEELRRADLGLDALADPRDPLPGGPARLAWWIESARLALAEGEPAPALELLDLAAARAEALSHAFGACWSLVLRGEALRQRDEAAAAQALLERARAEAASLEQPLLGGTLETYLAAAALDAGDLEGCRSALDRARQRLDEETPAACEAALVQVRLLRARGEASAAEELRDLLHQRASAQGWGALVEASAPQ